MAENIEGSTRMTAPCSTPSLPQLVPYRLYFRGRAHGFRVARAIAVLPPRPAAAAGPYSRPPDHEPLVRDTLRCLDHSTGWLCWADLPQSAASEALASLRRDTAAIAEVLVRDALTSRSDAMSGAVVIGYDGVMADLVVATGVPGRLVLTLDRTFDRNADRHRTLLRGLAGAARRAVA